MWSQRNFVSYALQRRSTLEALRRPSRTLTPSDACDADPMLIRAAHHHGQAVDEACPICERPLSARHQPGTGRLVRLNYVFGDQLGQYSGRIRSTPELEDMAHEYGEFKVVVVEVCVECGWNHILESWTLGDGVKRRPPRRQPTVEDIYG